MDNPILQRQRRQGSRSHLPLLRTVYISIFVIFLLFGVLSPAALAQGSETALIDQAVLLYHEGRFEEAELAALRALQNEETLAPVDRARLRRILGFIYVVLGENEKAKQQFIDWLELDPLARLDPVYISPKIIKVFEEAKQEYNRLKVQNPPPDYARLDLQVKATQRSLAFPGLGQIYQGQPTKGYALLGSELVLLGSLVYCQVRYNEARDLYLDETNPARMQSRYDDCNFYYWGRNASAILAVGVYLYSLFDVMFFPPKTQAGPPKLSLSAVSGSPGAIVILKLPLPSF